MKFDFDEQFDKDLRKMRKHHVAMRRIEKKLNEVIPIIEAADDEDELIRTLPSITKIVNHDFYYRLRVGDYRLGVEIILYGDPEALTLRFLRCGHRSDFYDVFPPVS